VEREREHLMDTILEEEEQLITAHRLQVGGARCLPVKITFWHTQACSGNHITAHRLQVCEYASGLLPLGRPQ
jgi:hypothetical protein